MKQAEKTYLISDAAKRVQVESHVLRYWEEELKLPIKRNEMGHRYYTEDDIRRFQEVRDLKEQGLQLKAIRNVLMREEQEGMKRHVVMVNKGEFMPVPEESREAKSLRLQQLLQNMIAEAVRSNNREMCDDIKESILKELDYQFRQQEEREEERDGQQIRRQEEYYRQLDELLRVRSKGKRWEKKNKGSTEPSADEITLFAQKRKMPEQKVQEVCGQAEERVSSADEKAGKKKGGFFLSKKRSIV
ncbi:helix-turn-helix domain-containing protein [Suilimivivens sp.]|uniref:helix-turn-helix domain-containing protein n=1 Tax=Suilimivivens sp. TaxID=2981669 RepID=UPI003079A9CF